MMPMTESRTWLWLAILLLAGWLLYLLGPVLMPFAVAALFAYLGDPLVDRLEAHMNRTLGVVVVFFGIVLSVLVLILLLLPMLEQQVSAFLSRIPRYLSWLQSTLLPWLEQHFGVTSTAVLDPEQVKSALTRHWREAGGVAAGVVNTLSRSGLALAALAANLVLIPVVTFYLLRDWDVLIAHVRQLLPRTIEQKVVDLARESDEVLGAFLRGQLMVMISLGIVYSVGLWLVGLDLALLMGMLAGTVSFVPYLGFIIGILAAGGAAITQFQELLPVVMVLGVFGVGQVLESVVLTPLLVGDRIGLHPVAVIFAVLAGGQLFGFVGVLLALPAASVIMVLLRHAHGRYLESGVYARSRDSDQE